MPFLTDPIPLCLCEGYEISADCTRPLCVKVRERRKISPPERFDAVEVPTAYGTFVLTRAE